MSRKIGADCGSPLQDRLGEAKVGTTMASLGDEVHKQRRHTDKQDANGGVHPHEAIV